MSGEEQYRALQRRARDDGRATDELLTLYALEGFLRRLQRSDYAGHFVLKGGMLLAALGARRPTRDVDIQAHGVQVDLDDLPGLITTVVAINADDGLVFDAESVSTASIRDEDEYTGVRVAVTARLHTGRLRLKLDISIGDPIQPDPVMVEIPSLLQGPPIRMPGFPLTMVLAEKAATALQRGAANTRWRDFGDIYLLARRHDVGASQLRESVMAVAEHRGVHLRPLSEVLDGFAEAEQPRWAAWRARRHLAFLPADLDEVIRVVEALIDPIIVGEIDDAVWSANMQRWSDSPGT